MIRLRDLISEDERSDRVKREQALNVLRKILDYIDKKGRKAFSVSGSALSPKPLSWKLDTEEIEDLPDYIDLQLKFEIVKDSSGPRGKARRATSHEVFGSSKPRVTMKVDGDEYSHIEDRPKKIYQYLKDHFEVFVHEFIHYLDTKRIPKGVDYSTSGKEYFNDPRELNAYYQQAATNLMNLLRSDPSFLKDKMDDWSDFQNFKDWFFKNMLDSKFTKNLSKENEKRIIKRLYGFYEETLPKIQDQVKSFNSSQ